MHKLVIKSRFRFFSILGKNLDFRFRIRESSITSSNQTKCKHLIARWHQVHNMWNLWK